MAFFREQAPVSALPRTRGLDERLADRHEYFSLRIYHREYSRRHRRAEVRTTDPPPPPDANQAQARYLCRCTPVEERCSSVEVNMYPGGRAGVLQRKFFIANC